jgi:hypothetical protein
MSKTHPKYLLSLLLVVAALSAGCRLTQSAFAKTTGNAGAAFAAASTTLAYAHSGRLTGTYAASSFVNYQGELAGLDQQLPSEQGVSDRRTLQHLLDLYHAAMQAVNSPCLDATCDWRSQVAALDRASKAFLEASDS